MAPTQLAGTALHFVQLVLDILATLREDVKRTGVPDASAMDTTQSQAKSLGMCKGGKHDLLLWGEYP